MPPVQTTYSQYPAKFVAGQFADMLPHRTISRTCETAGGIPFGALVMTGTTGDGMVRAAAAGGTYAGIAVMNPALVHGSSLATPDAYAQYEQMTVMISGTIAVAVGADVTQDAQAGFIPATGAFVPASTAGATAIPNSRFMATATSGSLVKLLIDG